MTNNIQTVSMDSSTPTISACLVVFNEEKVIEHCLQSLVNWVDEIIVVHDGPCSDRTLEIARRYTDRVIVRPHGGACEYHRSFIFREATREWVLMIDADEYIDESGARKIKQLITDPAVGGYMLPWEMWNGQKVVTFPGLQKLALFRRDSVAYVGVLHEPVTVVKGEVRNTDVVLHHRPAYNNVAWASFWRKMKRWVPLHAAAFFAPPEAVDTFNTTPEQWVARATQIRVHPYRSLCWQPLKMVLGQLKNGLWRSRHGWQAALQQGTYYTWLYWKIAQMQRKAKGAID